MRVCMCIYIYILFSKSWLSFNQHTTVSDPLAPRPCPLWYWLSLPNLHFPNLQASAMWLAAPPPPSSPSFVPLRTSFFQPILLLPILDHTPVSRHQPWIVNHSAMEILFPGLVLAWALPAHSCPETLSAGSQLWQWLLAHLALGDERWPFPAPSDR